MAFAEEIDLWLSNTPEGAFVQVENKDLPAELEAAKKRVQQPMQPIETAYADTVTLQRGFLRRANPT